MIRTLYTIINAEASAGCGGGEMRTGPVHAMSHALDKDEADGIAQKFRDGYRYSNFRPSDSTWIQWAPETVDGHQGMYMPHANAFVYVQESQIDVPDAGKDVTRLLRAYVSLFTLMLAGNEDVPVTDFLSLGDIRAIAARHGAKVPEMPRPRDPEPVIDDDVDDDDEDAADEA